MSRRCLTQWHIEFVHVNEHSIATTNIHTEKTVCENFAA